MNLKGYGFTFASRHSDDFNLILEDTIHSLTPELNTQILNVPKRSGAWYFRTDLGSRIIHLKVALQADTPSNFSPDIRSISSWLNPLNGPQSLVFDNDPNITYQGLLYTFGGQTIDISRLFEVGQMDLYFYCPDPFGYGAASPTLNITSGTASETLTLEANSSECFPVINVTFSAAATEYKITHSESGEFVRVIYNFAINDKLLIDCSKGLIQVNGVNQMPALDINSDFIALVPGTNTLTIAPSSVGSTTVDHTPRYL